MKPRQKNKKQPELEKPISQTISYSGEVSITLKRNNRVISSTKIKNNGTQLLFQGICLSLLGAPNKDLLPNFIGVGTSSEDLSSEKPFNLANEAARSKINRSYLENISSSYYATFAANIPWTYLPVDTYIKEVGLFGTDTQNNGDTKTSSLLARIKIEGDGIKVAQGTNFIIEWKISIKN